MSLIDVDVFNRNLLLTQQYCESQLLNTEKSDAEILRSINLEYNGAKIFEFQSEYPFGCNANWNIEPIDIVPELLEIQLTKKNNILNGLHDSKVTGRILACEFEDTVLDGASEFESSGIMDVYDLPPIDTWFYIADSSEKKILYSWIPERLISLVEKGVQVNPLDILYWIDDLKDAVTKLLHNY